MPAPFNNGFGDLHGGAQNCDLQDEMNALRQQQVAAIINKIPEKSIGIRQPAPGRGTGAPIDIIILRELMNAMEYLLDDVRGNVRRNPKLQGVDTNWAMRRAQAALDVARANTGAR